MDDIAQQLRELIYRIEPEETPCVVDRPAWAPSRKQRKKLAQLERQLRRYQRKLQRAERRFYAAQSPHTDKARTEWLVDMLTSGMQIRRDLEIGRTR